jgi:flagellar biogenesis protein FliO
MNNAGATAGCSPFQQLRAGVLSPFRWLKSRLAARRHARRLRLLETLSLGAHRFIAVVQVEHHEFLVGSAGNSIVLLARLDPKGNGSEEDSGHRREGVQRV